MSAVAYSPEVSDYLASLAGRESELRQSLASLESFFETVDALAAQIGVPKPTLEEVFALEGRLGVDYSAALNGAAEQFERSQGPLGRLPLAGAHVRQAFEQALQEARAAGQRLESWRQGQELAVSASTRPQLSELETAPPASSPEAASESIDL